MSDQRSNSDSDRTLSRAFAQLAELEYQLGDWPAAYSSAVDALRSARFAGLEDETMAGLVRLALLEAGLGRAGACRRHAAEAIELSRRRRAKAIEANACEALGLLELGLGRIDTAIEQLDRAALICAEHPSARASAVTWAPDMVDACIQRGDRAGAEQALAKLEERASQSGTCALASAVERSRAMIAAENEFEKIFRRALSLATRARRPFEQARTELYFGEYLCRVRRGRQAHELFARALHTFDALRSEPWAERARDGLAATAADTAEAAPTA